MFECTEARATIQCTFDVSLVDGEGDLHLKYQVVKSILIGLEIVLLCPRKQNYYGQCLIPFVINQVFACNRARAVDDLDF